MLLCWPLLQAGAQTDTLLINLKNGSTEKIAVTDIQKIVFENVTGVEDLPEQSNNLTLKGNFPNPFSEGTTIEFEIERPGAVEIVIYDNAGEKIRKLTCTDCHAGSNQLQWDCRNEKGTRVQSGAYFYEVRFGGEVLSKKMLIVR